jgi:hypothetical protein
VIPLCSKHHEQLHKWLATVKCELCRVDRQLVECFGLNPQIAEQKFDAFREMESEISNPSKWCRGCGKRLAASRPGKLCERCKKKRKIDARRRKANKVSRPKPSPANKKRAQQQHEKTDEAAVATDCLPSAKRPEPPLRQ